MAVFALCPLVCLIVLAVRSIRRGYRRMKTVVPEKVGLPWSGAESKNMNGIRERRLKESKRWLI